jgi:hypothetical protein
MVIVNNERLLTAIKSAYKVPFEFGKDDATEVLKKKREGSTIDPKLTAFMRSEKVALELAVRADRHMRGDLSVRTVQTGTYNASVIVVGNATRKRNGAYLPTITLCYDRETEATKKLKEYIKGELKFK